MTLHCLAQALHWQVSIASQHLLLTNMHPECIAQKMVLILQKIQLMRASRMLMIPHEADL